jgi:FKBP-type peptidyl-prolyl cis-trans isomerase
MNAQDNLQKGKDFLEQNAQQDGVISTASGLQYKVLEEGAGSLPSANDQVTVHYRGTSIDGAEFDSSYSRGQPATFPVGGVISGWVEALQIMPQGSKWELYIPSNLAYGERGAPPSIGPNETLVFEVELLKVV